MRTGNSIVVGIAVASIVAIIAGLTMIASTLKSAQFDADQRSRGDAKFIEGSGLWRYRIAYDDRYQEALRLYFEQDNVKGEPDEKTELFCDVTLVPHAGGADDPDAIAVRVDGRTVGFIPHGDVSIFRAAMNGGEINALGLIVPYGPQDNRVFALLLDIEFPIVLS